MKSLKWMNPRHAAYPIGAPATPAATIAPTIPSTFIVVISPTILADHTASAPRLLPLRPPASTEYPRSRHAPLPPLPPDATPLPPAPPVASRLRIQSTSRAHCPRPQTHHHPANREIFSRSIKSIKSPRPCSLPVLPACPSRPFCPCLCRMPLEWPHDHDSPVACPPHPARRHR